MIASSDHFYLEFRALGSFNAEIYRRYTYACTDVGCFVLAAKVTLEPIRSLISTHLLCMKNLLNLEALPRTVEAYATVSS